MDLLRHPDGCGILRVNDRTDGIVLRVVECPTQAGTSRFRREPEAAAGCMDVIADFEHATPLYRLKGQACVADELSGSPHLERPQAKAELPVVTLAPLDPAPELFLL